MYVVYCHTNLLTLKSYIGYSKYSMNERWTKGHVIAANQGKRFALSIAIRKYGTECWSHVELETYERIEDAKEAEIFFISTLQTLMPNGYNMTEGGDGARGDVVSKRTKEAMQHPSVKERIRITNNSPITKQRKSKATALSWQNPVMRVNHRMGWEASTKVKRYDVQQLDKNSHNIISTYRSLREACRQTNVARTSIQEHLKGNLDHAGGFIWRRVKSS